MVINKPFRIVILGAGYAGMFLAINLYQSLKEMSKGDRKGKNSSADVEIILIDRNSYHQLLQEIHLVAAGYRTAEQISIPVTSLIYSTEIRFIQSNVNEIRAGEHKDRHRQDSSAAEASSKRMPHARHSPRDIILPSRPKSA